MAGVGIVTGLGKLSVCEKRPEGIFVREKGGGSFELVERPGYGQSRVVPEHAAFSGGGVSARGFVEDFGGVGEDKKAVGKAFRDPEHFELAGGGTRAEVEACPLAEGGRVAAEVEGDVPDVAVENTD